LKFGYAEDLSTESGISSLPSGLILNNNYITGIPKNIYPLYTKFYVRYSKYPIISGIVDCENNIILETSFTEDLPYINGIGVVSYHIETKQQEMPEFYTPEVPYIVSSDCDNYSAYGWLYNAENILGDINETYNSYKDSPISSFIINNVEGIASGFAVIPITCEYTGVYGTLSGILSYNLNEMSMTNNICHGYLVGNLYYPDSNRLINVDAYCTGRITDFVLEQLIHIF
jgi:hypothetical protein